MGSRRIKMVVFACQIALTITIGIAGTYWYFKSRGLRTNELVLWTLGDEVVGLSVSPDGKSLVAVGSLGVVAIWDLENYQVRKYFCIPTQSAHAFAILNNGKSILTSDTNGNLTVTNLSTGETIRQIKVENGSIIRSMFYAKDNDLLLTADIEDNLLMWRLSDDGAVAKKTSIAGSVVSYSNKHQLVAWSTWGSLRVARISKNDVDEVFRKDIDGVSKAHALDDSDYFAVSRRDGSIVVIDLAKTTVLFAEMIHHKAALSVRMGNGALVLSGGGDGRAVLTNWKNKELIAAVRHPTPVTDVCFSKDEKEFFVASDAFHITMHNSETGNLIRVLPLE
jgi:hypothetical protein